MNCWEFAFYAAFVSGQVTHGELAALHREAQAAGLGYHTVLGAALGEGG